MLFGTFKVQQFSSTGFTSENRQPPERFSPLSERLFLGRRRIFSKILLLPEENTVYFQGLLYTDWKNDTFDLHTYSSVHFYCNLSSLSGSASLPPTLLFFTSPEYCLCLIWSNFGLANYAVSCFVSGQFDYYFSAISSVGDRFFLYQYREMLVTK